MKLMIWSKTKGIAVIGIIVSTIVLGCAQEKNSQDKEPDQGLVENVQNYTHSSTVENILEGFLDEYTFVKSNDEEWIVYECIPKKGSDAEEYGLVKIRLNDSLDNQLQNFADVSGYVKNILDFETIRQIQNGENELGITKIYEAIGEKEACYVVYFGDMPNLIWITGKNVLDGKLLSQAPNYEDLLEETQKPVIQ